MNAAPPICETCGKRHGRPWLHAGECEVRDPSKPNGYCGEPVKDRYSDYCQGHIDALNAELSKPVAPRPVTSAVFGRRDGVLDV